MGRYRRALHLPSEAVAYQTQLAQRALPDGSYANAPSGAVSRSNHTHSNNMVEVGRRRPARSSREADRHKLPKA
jgi:hypothetical protein